MNFAILNEGKINAIYRNLDLHIFRVTDVIKDCVEIVFLSESATVCQVYRYSFLPW